MVSVLDSNDRPSNILMSAPPSVPENTEGNTNIIFFVTDQDESQTHKCFVDQMGQEFFTIVNETAGPQLWVKDDVVLDYEKNKTVRCKFFDDIMCLSTNDRNLKKTSQIDSYNYPLLCSHHLDLYSK